eukprot:COSAG02_NODE_29212_length_574_cov_0.570526_2_plen_139_part_01
MGGAEEGADRPRAGLALPPSSSVLEAVGEEHKQRPLESAAVGTGGTGGALKQACCSCSCCRIIEEGGRSALRVATDSPTQTTLLGTRTRIGIALQGKGRARERFAGRLSQRHQAADAHPLPYTRAERLPTTAAADGATA